MWTRKAAIMLTSGISLILIGMMISHFQLMIIGLTFIAFLVINGWVTGHSDLEITRNISAQNVYKGDDILVEVSVTNNSYRRTQLLEVFDNVPHEMKMRRGINQMRMNLGPGQSATMRYTVRCPLRGHYTVGPVSVRHRNAFNLFVNESKVDDRTDITVFPQVREVEAAATVPISNGFLRTVPILATSLVSRMMNTSVTASRVFSLTINSPVLANAFQLIIRKASPGRYSRRE